MWTRWAIRHKPTGNFMPASNKKRRGYSHDEPVPLGESNHCPRLFARKQDASTALTWWLKGETFTRWTTDYYGDVDEEWHTEPVANRKPEDFEVVQVSIEVKGE